MFKAYLLLLGRVYGAGFNHRHVYLSCVLHVIVKGAWSRNYRPGLEISHVHKAPSLHHLPTSQHRNKYVFKE